MGKIRYYWFAIRWMYRNRSWDNTRQKYKALEKDYVAYERERSRA